MCSTCPGYGVPLWHLHRRTSKLLWSSDSWTLHTLLFLNRSVYWGDPSPFHCINRFYGRQIHSLYSPQYSRSAKPQLELIQRWSFRDPEHDSIHDFCCTWEKGEYTSFVEGKVINIYTRRDYIFLKILMDI